MSELPLLLFREQGFLFGGERGWVDFGGDFFGFGLAAGGAEESDVEGLPAGFAVVIGEDGQTFLCLAGAQAREGGDAADVDRFRIGGEEFLGGGGGGFDVLSGEEAEEGGTESCGGILRLEGEEFVGDGGSVGGSGGGREVAELAA